MQAGEIRLRQMAMESYGHFLGAYPTWCLRWPELQIVVDEA